MLFGLVLSICIALVAMSLLTDGCCCGGRRGVQCGIALASSLSTSQSVLFQYRLV